MSEVTSFNINGQEFDIVDSNDCDILLMNDESSADINIGDEDGNVLAQFINGHIRTQNFDSENISLKTYFNHYYTIGDSITYGSNASGQQYFTYFKDYCGFSTVQSDGVGGRELINSKSVLPNIPEDIDCLSILEGTNDWGHNLELGSMDDNEDASTFYGALKYFCQWFATNRPDISFFFCTPVQRNCDYWPADGITKGTWTNSYGYKLDDYCAAIKEVCAFYGVPVLDLFSSTFNGHNDNTKSLILTDGLHPNAAGHKIMARKIAKFINYTL